MCLTGCIVLSLTMGDTKIGKCEYLCSYVYVKRAQSAHAKTSAHYT